VVEGFVGAEHVWHAERTHELDRFRRGLIQLLGGNEVVESPRLMIRVR